MANIIVFGDSITYGAWDKEGGWAARLRKDLDKSHAIYNLGISGDTTEGLLNRFENEIKNRIDDEEEVIIIFAIGINDSQYITQSSIHKVSLEKFKENLETLFSLAKKYTNKVVFVGLTPVDESKTAPWDLGKEYKNEYIKKYDEAIKNVCNKNNINYIELFSMLKSKQELLGDGLHPNTKGHSLIYKAILDYLSKSRIIGNNWRQELVLTEGLENSIKDC